MVPIVLFIYFMLKTLTLLVRQFSISKRSESPITSPFGKIVKMNSRAMGAMSDFTGKDKEKLPFMGHGENETIWS